MTVLYERCFQINSRNKRKFSTRKSRHIYSTARACIRTETYSSRTEDFLYAHAARKNAAELELREILPEKAGGKSGLCTYGEIPNFGYRGEVPKEL
jgi:hypothetical protein